MVVVYCRAELGNRFVHPSTVYLPHWDTAAQIRFIRYRIYGPRTARRARSAGDKLI